MCPAQTVKEAAPELTASSSEAEEEKEEHVKVDGEGDPDFGQVHTHTRTSEPPCLTCVCCQTIHIFDHNSNRHFSDLVGFFLLKMPETPYTKQ